MGGWPEGVDPIKHSNTNNNNVVNDNDDDDDDDDDSEDGELEGNVKDNGKQELPSTNTSLLPPPITKIVAKLTKEAADEIVVEILECRENDETWDSIAIAMDQKKSHLKTLYSRSNHPDALEYKAKLKEEKLTKEAADEIVVEILEHRANDETWDSIAVAMGGKEASLKFLYSRSNHPDALEYKAKLKEEKLIKEAANEIRVNDETWDSIVDAMRLNLSQVKTLHFRSTNSDVLDYIVKLKEEKLTKEAANEIVVEIL